MTAKKSGDFDKDLIRELAELLEETGLTEIEIEIEGRRVRVARGAKAAASFAPDPGHAALRLRPPGRRAQPTVARRPARDRPAAAAKGSQESLRSRTQA